MKRLTDEETIVMESDCYPHNLSCVSILELNQVELLPLIENDRNISRPDMTGVKRSYSLDQIYIRSRS